MKFNIFCCKLCTINRNQIQLTMKRFLHVIILGLLFTSLAIAQTKDNVIQNMITEANENSQLERLAHELLDVVGPRLGGTPQMKQANDGAVASVGTGGLTARDVQYGVW